MTKRATYLLLIAITVLLGGCGEYQQIQKSKDPDLKYQAALQYFNNKQYTRAQTLLDDVTIYYKGTERSEDIVCYLARCYMGNKDYTTSAEYYEAYVRNYPKGKYIIEARYQVGNCYYMDAPDPRLDQEITKKAIKWFTEFVELFGDSPYAEQAYTQLDELYDRLAQKEYYNAKLYYDLGTYPGNASTNGGSNYEACVVTAQNALKDYPYASASLREDLSILVLRAKYYLARQSVTERQMERYRDAIDEYYAFQNDFPESQYMKEAKNILNSSERIVSKKGGLQDNDDEQKENKGRTISEEEKETRKRRDSQKDSKRDLKKIKESSVLNNS